MTSLLLGEPLAQRLHEPAPPAKRRDIRHFFGGQQPFPVCAQPVLRQLSRERGEQFLCAAKVGGEHPVEAVIVALVLDEAGARKEVELLDLEPDHAGLQRTQERQEFRQRDGDARGSQHQEKLNEHRAD